MMYRESEILLEILHRLQDLPKNEFITEAKRLTGISFSRTLDDIFWDVTGDCEPKTKIGLLN